MAKSNRIWVKHALGFVAIRPIDILYVKGHKYGSSLCFCDKFNFNKTRTILSKNTITLFEEELKIYGFIRCHRNYLVNSLIIDSYSSNESAVFLNENIKIPVSKRRKKYLVNQSKICSNENR